MRKIIALIILGYLLSSCKGKTPDLVQDKKEFTFEIMENLYMKTSIGKPGQFFVTFSNDSLKSLSDSIDYIEFQRHAMGPINFILDPANKNDIYLVDSEYRRKVNITNYNLHILNRDEFYSRFFEPSVGYQPSKLKYPYISIWISTETYSVSQKRYDVVHKWLK